MKSFYFSVQFIILCSKNFITENFVKIVFFYQGFLSQTLTIHRTVGEETGPFLFISSTSTRSRTFRNFFLATLHVSWLLRIFNCTTCIYQIATRWDLPLYWITIWLIYDILLNFVRFLDDFFLVFLLQQLTWKTDGFDESCYFLSL